jgi:inhibitor of the pro-sigma K processing machinery
MRIALTAAAGVLVLLIGISGKMEWLLNIAIRCIFGTIGIYCINYIFNKIGIMTMVGINPITVLTSGILGIPGIAVLYGIELYHFL